jgi:sec-independent protein translocase protein TatA
MFGLGVWELVLILIILIFLYGAKRLPQIGEGLGKSLREFKEAYGTYGKNEEVAQEVQAEVIREEYPDQKEPLYLLESSVTASEEKNAGEHKDSGN